MQIGEIQSWNVLSPSEDTKILHLVGEEGVVEMTVTDETLPDFLSAIEDLTISMHDDMASMMEAHRDRRPG